LASSPIASSSSTLHYYAVLRWYYQQNVSLDFPELFGLCFCVLIHFTFPDLRLFSVHVCKLLSPIACFYLENYGNNVFNSTLHNLDLLVCRHFNSAALYAAVVLFSDPFPLTCNNVLSATWLSMCACTF
jgi:hypothetical protein